ncbi:hypothetical protein MASR1M65_28510 [Saprospiraceae bacterium]
MKQFNQIYTLGNTAHFTYLVDTCTQFRTIALLYFWWTYTQWCDLNDGCLTPNNYTKIFTPNHNVQRMKTVPR